MSDIDRRLSPEDREFLEALLTLEELHEAATELGRDKVPGADGIPVEFFLMFWRVLGRLLLKALNAGISKGEFSKKFLKSLIVLLHKKGDPTVLQNKRVISLLNASYKIGARPIKRGWRRYCAE
jgi:hypothetical protein